MIAAYQMLGRREIAQTAFSRSYWLLLAVYCKSSHSCRILAKRTVVGDRRYPVAVAKPQPVNTVAKCLRWSADYAVK